jgi:protein-tyrosine-phosphatase
MFPPPRRSAALLQHSSGAAVQVASAGTRPAQRVQPEVATVLAELGLGTGRSLLGR